MLKNFAYLNLHVYDYMHCKSELFRSILSNANFTLCNKSDQHVFLIHQILLSHLRVVQILAFLTPVTLKILASQAFSY